MEPNRVGLHAHKLATNLWLERHGSNGEIEEFAADRPYLFESQRTSSIVPPMPITPTDKLVVNCQYDSMSETEITYGGDESTQEMCLAFVYVTPMPIAQLKDPGLGACFADPMTVSN